MSSSVFVILLFAGYVFKVEAASCEAKRSYRVEYCPQGQSNQCSADADDCNTYAWICRNNYPNSIVQYHCCPTGCNNTATCQQPAVYKRSCPSIINYFTCNKVPVFATCSNDTSCPGDQLCCPLDNCGNIRCRNYREIDCGKTDCTVY